MHCWSLFLSCDPYVIRLKSSNEKINHGEVLMQSYKINIGHER